MTVDGTTTEVSPGASGSGCAPGAGVGSPDRADRCGSRYPSRALRTWVRQAEADAGQRPEQLTSAEREELRRPREENSELKRANEMLALGDTKQQVERIAACN